MHAFLNVACLFSFDLSGLLRDAMRNYMNAIVYIDTVSSDCHYFSEEHQQYYMD